MVRILVVDDEEDIRRISTKILESVGHEVDTAEDGAIALELIKKKQYELILLDVMMPNVTGLEVCRNLKRNPHTKDIPVIMFSALGTGTKLMLEKEDQADGYLQKPFTMSILREKVDQVLRDKRQHTVG